MAISLNAETQRMIEEMMAEHGFSCADEAVRAALLWMEQQDQLRRIGTEDLEAVYRDFRQKITQGLADADAGRVSDGEQFFAELEREEADGENHHGRRTA